MNEVLAGEAKAAADEMRRRHGWRSGQGGYELGMWPGHEEHLVGALGRQLTAAERHDFEHRVIDALNAPPSRPGLVAVYRALSRRLAGETRHEVDAETDREQLDAVRADLDADE